MDRIDLLEAKVKEMIGMVQTLREENQSLKDQLAAATESLDSMRQEQNVLDEERTVVRDRIEQLLGDLEEIQVGMTGDAPGDAAGTTPEAPDTAEASGSRPEPVQEEVGATGEEPSRFEFRASTDATGDSPEEPRGSVAETDERASEAGEPGRDFSEDRTLRGMP